jgi:uncharacterized coiled-coil protein SlyX
VKRDSSHALDTLETIVSTQRTAQLAAEHAEEKADRAVRLGRELNTRVTVLESQGEKMDGKLDRVLERLGQLAESSWWDRTLKRSAYGLVALWVLRQLAQGGLW